MKIEEIHRKIAELEDIEKTLVKNRNALISAGLGKEADNRLGDIMKAKQQRADLEKQVVDIQNTMAEKTFAFAFGMDMCYYLAMEEEEYFNKVAEEELGFKESVAGMRKFLHDSIAVIDAEGLPLLSESYAEATDELDEYMQAEVLPKLKEIYKKHSANLLRAWKHVRR